MEVYRIIATLPEHGDSGRIEDIEMHTAGMDRISTYTLAVRLLGDARWIDISIQAQRVPIAGSWEKVRDLGPQE